MSKQLPYDQASRQTGVVLIEFYASWCPHCQRMMPVVEQVKELLNGQVPVYQYDIDQHQDWAAEAQVESIPTFIICDNAEEVWRQSGEMDGQVLLDTVDAVLGSVDPDGQ